MKNVDEIIKIARQTLDEESKALSNQSDRIGETFAKAVRHIIQAKGKLVLTGIGKSAIIGMKISSTMNSTGTTSSFMHAADAIHGDIGMLDGEDTVLCISNSGNTAEIKALVPLIKGLGNTLIGITGNSESFLGKESDFAITYNIDKEACPLNLAPTTSTTVQLALGDALAVALLHCRDFSAEDFAKNHPGGSLGKKLYLRTGDLAKRNEKPEVSSNHSLSDTILEITSKRLGAAVVTENGKCIGIVTDGDLRRFLMNSTQMKEVKAADVMSKNPVSIDSAELAVNVVDIFKNKKITQLVVTENGKYFGLIHFHDILREGLI